MTEDSRRIHSPSCRTGTSPTLAPNGIVIVDNAIWHGWVLDDTHDDADTAGMRAFNRALAADARVEGVLLPVADGMMLVRRRSGAAAG